MRAPHAFCSGRLVAPDRSALLRQLSNTEEQLKRRINEALNRKRMQLQHLRQRLRHPRERLQQHNQRLDDLNLRLLRAMQARVLHNKQSYNHLQARLNVQHPQAALSAYKVQLNTLQQRLAHASQYNLRQAKLNLQGLLQTLQVVSPLATLERGYSILSSADEQQVISSIKDVQPEQILHARVTDGYLTLRVADITPYQNNSTSNEPT